ncbi:MAG: UDP-glucose 4-epimerase GalE [Armatimonadota bacterium]|jgi:UDP-glucose 4-epimerase|nr:UDP-glucose 4-epimerase GalE [Fimbriimonadaceae bacterium]
MVLVVGGAGYIGSAFARQLKAAGTPHIIYDNLEAGHPESVAYTRVIPGDTRDPGRLQRVIREHNVTTVAHFAAHIEVGEGERDPARFYDNNTYGTLCLLQAMREVGVGQLIFSSTAAVYGEPETVPIPEDHPLRPTSVYGRTKLASEQMIRDFTRAYGLRHVIFRYFNAAGADANGGHGEAHQPESHLIPLCIQAALGQRPALKVFGDDFPTPDGTCVRDYLHTADLASAHIRAVAHLQEGGESATYNLGTGRGHSVREVIATVGDVLGTPVPHEDAPRRAGDPAQLVASSASIQADWGWTSAHSDLTEIVKSAAKWHRTHPAGYKEG